MWDLGVFGLGEKRAIDFTALHQRWLRESAKGYTIERLSSRKRRTAQRDVALDSATCPTICTAARTAASEPSALTREDMTGVPVVAAGPGARQEPAAPGRQRDAPQRCSSPAGTSRSPARPASRVGGGFQLYHEDLPARTLRDPDEPGRALPAVVLAQLLDEEVLAPLGGKHLEYRLGFELIAHSGRRPGRDLQPRRRTACATRRSQRPAAASSAGRCCATCARSRPASG